MALYLLNLEQFANIIFMVFERCPIAGSTPEVRHK